MTARTDGLAILRRQVRQAIADYMYAEGCSCCRNIDAHREAAARLAGLLQVPKYSDGSGFDFYRFQSKPMSDRTPSRAPARIPSRQPERPTTPKRERVPRPK